jgi:hypothetical protein
VTDTGEAPVVSGEDEGADGVRLVEAKAMVWSTWWFMSCNDEEWRPELGKSGETSVKEESDNARGSLEHKISPGDEECQGGLGGAVCMLEVLGSSSDYSPELRLAATRSW